MGFKIKNSLTGEFEKLPILTLKGEKGETGGVEEYNKVDYMGNKYETLKQTNDANVEYAVKTAIGEFNYLDYEGQHITATDTIEGRSKSAILKGQTLVNLAQSTKPTNLNGEYVFRDNFEVLNFGCNMIKPSTTYTIISNIIENSANFLNLEWNTTLDECAFKEIIRTDGSLGIRKFKVSSKDDLSNASKSIRFFPSNKQENGTLTITFMLLEGDYTNVDIPYFEGMQSVRMPVLKTTGKNLFDISQVTNFEVVDNNIVIPINSGKKELIPLTNINPNQPITITLNHNVTQPNGSWTPIIGVSYKDGTNIERYYHQLPLITSDDKIIESIYIRNPWSVGAELYDVQIEQGTVATTYEPHKTNILTVNEDIELRGIGEGSNRVEDELDCLTGQVTERVGEIVLDGSEDEGWKDWWHLTNTVGCYIFNGIPNNGKAVVNNIPYNDINGGDESNDIEGYNLRTDGTLFVRILKSKLSSPDLNGFKEYLASNPIVIQYGLTQESIKTVDLSDNHVYSYKGTTHYDCSSAEGSLVPTLSVKVPTDVQATIAQQRETIQTLNSENERLNQIQEALKASMLDSQVQLMNLSWDTDFEVFALRESIAPKDFPMVLKTGSNIDKFSQAKFIIENDCPDLEKLNSQIGYYFSKDVFSQEQFEELTDLISIVKGGNGCEY